MSSKKKKLFNRVPISKVTSLTDGVLYDRMLRNIDETHSSSSNSASKRAEALHHYDSRALAEPQLSPLASAVFEMQRPSTIQHIHAPSELDLSLHKLVASCSGFNFGTDDVDDDEQGRPSGRVSPCTFLAWSRGCTRWDAKRVRETPSIFSVKEDSGSQEQPAHYHFHPLYREPNQQICNEVPEYLPVLTRPEQAAAFKTHLSVDVGVLAEQHYRRHGAPDYDHAIPQYDQVTGEQLSPFYNVPSEPSILYEPLPRHQGIYGPKYASSEEGNAQPPHGAQDSRLPSIDRHKVEHDNCEQTRPLTNAPIHHHDHHQNINDDSASNAQYTVNDAVGVADYIAQQWSLVSSLRREEDALDRARDAQRDREGRLDQQLAVLRERVEISRLRSEAEVRERRLSLLLLLPLPSLTETVQQPQPQQQQHMEELERHARHASAVFDVVRSRAEQKRRDRRDADVAIGLMEREVESLRRILDARDGGIAGGDMDSGAMHGGGNCRDSPRVEGDDCPSAEDSWSDDEMF